MRLVHVARVQTDTIFNMMQLLITHEVDKVVFDSKCKKRKVKLKKQWLIAHTRCSSLNS